MSSGLHTMRLAALRAAQRLVYDLAESVDEQVFRLTFDSWLRGRFRPRADDVYIASYPKSGTTWMQMLLYQLTTAGDMSFRHIYEVSPWLTLPHPSRSLGLSTAVDLDALPAPRLFKTHLGYRTLPRWLQGRFVFVTRDCLDMAASMLHHQRSYNDPGATYEQVFDSCFRCRGPGNWFQYTAQWLENDFGRAVLHVRYEDMKKDLEAVVRRIAAFLGVTVAAGDLPRIVERSSLAFMKKHEEKFGERPDEALPAPPPRVYDNFIRKGESGEGRHYATEEQLAFVQRALERFRLAV